MINPQHFSLDSLLILSCSPRPSGNSDAAARFFLEGIEEAFPERNAHIRHLRQFSVTGCTGCGSCERWARSLSEAPAPVPSADEDRPFLGCPHSLRDDSRSLLPALLAAKEICIVTPIYFYHLPSQFKALLDRMQPLWALARNGLSPFREVRSCKCILLAAREKGEELFKGSLLTLKYALGQAHMEIAPPLLLYGLDGPADLDNDQEKIRRIRAYAKQ